MKISTTRILRAAVAIVIITIATVLFISIRQSQRVKDTATAVSETQEMLHHIESLLLNVVDNETSARGYLITGNEDYSALAKNAEEEIRNELSVIRKMITDTAAQRLIDDSLVFYINKRIDFSHEMIAARRLQGMEKAASLVSLGQGKFYTAEIRNIAASLQQREENSLQQRQTRNDKMVSQLGKTLYIVLAAVFVLSMLIIRKVKSDVHFIIQRRKREEDLRKSEERFRLLVSNVKDYAIYMIDADGKVASWNTGAEKIKGYSSGEILGRYISVFYTPEDNATREPAYNLEMAKKHGHFEKEGWRLRKDGSLFWANIVISALFDEKGQLQGYAKITRDITERKKSEEQLQMLSRQLNQANDAIYISNSDRIIISWNKGAEKLYGYSSEEAIGADTNALLQTSISEEELERTLKNLEENDHWSGDLQRKSKSGKNVFVWASTTTIRDQHGKITGYISVNIDVTERRALENKLKKFNEELASQVEQKTAELTGIFERVTDAFIALDKDFRYRYINNIAGKMIHRDPASLIGRKAVDEFPYIVNTELYAGLTKAMSTQQPVVVTEYYEQLGLVLENYIYPAPDGLSVFIRDISEQKRTEKELKAAHEQLSSILNTLPANIALLDEKGIIVDINEAWKNFTPGNGLIHKDYGIGTDYLAVALTVHEPDAKDGKAVVEGILGVLSGRLKNYTFEYSHEVKGNKKWFRLIVTPLLQKEKAGAVLMHIDITEQKISEDELRLSEQKYKLLFESNPMPMWMRAVDSMQVIDVNKAACNAYGYTKKEFMQLHHGDLRHPDEMESFMSEFQLEMPHPVNRGIWKHKKKDGTYIDVEIYAQDILYNNQKVRLILAKDVTEQLKAEEQLKNSYQEIRRLASYLQNVREEERKNMAREIHDQLGQQLTVMKMDISWLERKIHNADELTLSKMAELRGITDDTINLVRRIASDLRPGLLDDMGLIAALEWQLEDFQKRSGVVTKFNGMSEEPELGAAAKTNIFRIVQESLTNIARYAQAKNVIVSLEQREKQLILSIKDDGVGFDKDKIASVRTLGILGMRERTAMMGGNYAIISTKGEGTTVVVTVPV